MSRHGLDARLGESHAVNTTATVNAALIQALMLSLPTRLVIPTSAQNLPARPSEVGPTHGESPAFSVFAARDRPTKNNAPPTAMPTPPATKLAAAILPSVLAWV